MKCDSSKLVTGIYENLPGNLRFLRILKGLSQEAIGEMVHVSRRHYCDCESGLKLPNLITVCLLAEFYDVPLDTLISSKITYTFEDTHGKK